MTENYKGLCIHYKYSDSQNNNRGAKNGARIKPQRIKIEIKGMDKMEHIRSSICINFIFSLIKKIISYEKNPRDESEIYVKPDDVDGEFFICIKCLTLSPKIGKLEPEFVKVIAWKIYSGITAMRLVPVKF
ncbi:hypothetical protein [Candidatus Methanoperedens nitratireducens]|uniref:hypothetical protein n=1 Tax=Candidatus Methanoperedens nitratireducens TaxID=1392998 RepID=UPI000BB6DF26|nr:hypothetical protein [Candidatus Methanoperedens nitroreducens]